MFNFREEVSGLGASKLSNRYVRNGRLGSIIMLECLHTQQCVIRAMKN